MRDMQTGKTSLQTSHSLLLEVHVVVMKVEVKYKKFVYKCVPLADCSSERKEDVARSDEWQQLKCQ